MKKLGQLGSLGSVKMAKPPFPTGGAAKGALAYVGQFAHHVPAPLRVGRMERPRGGKGPKNPVE
jgi:hypothetical protein